jgi:acyl carrier protein
MPDGLLRHTGRKDHQVKIRGFRVDITEVESSLTAQASVSGAAVVLDAQATGRDRLIGFYTAAPDTCPSGIDLRKALSEALPSYMVPAYFMRLDSMPTTASGKVNRNALPEIVTMPRDPANPYRAPRNDIDEKLVTIWSDFLRIDGIGIDDDFFDSGGDSLEATNVMLEVEKHFGLTMDAESFLDALNSIRKISDAVTNMKVAPSADSRKSLDDIDFVEFQAVQKTNMPSLYFIDKKTGLRRAKPSAKLNAVQINSLGFRGPEISKKKASNVLRIAYMGSSNTFDPRVKSNENTWVHQAHTLLQSKYDDVGFDYVNAALPGYSTKMLIPAFTHYVATLKPDIVVIKINDLA